MIRRARRPAGATRVLIVLFTAAAVLAVAAPASAHSELVRSDPADGGVLADGRTMVSLWFAQPVAAGGTFAVRPLGGDAVPTTASIPDASAPGYVEIVVPQLERGTYELDWAVRSADDGHESTGVLRFGVGVRPAGGPSGSAQTFNPRVSLVRWIDLTAIMLLLGTLAVGGRVLGSMGEAGRAPRRRARRIGVAAAAVAAAVGLVTPLLRAPEAGEAAWLTLWSTGWGRLWLARELALVAAAVFLWRRDRSDDPKDRPGIVLPIAAAVLLLDAGTGHAAALPTRAVLAELVAAVHLGAAGVWAGGLTVLAICVLPVMRRDPESRGPMLASVWQAFGPAAAVATVVLVATGVYESGRHLPALGALRTTTYGGAVTFKVALVAVALVLAACNALLVHPNVAAPVGRLLRRPVGWAPVSLRRFPVVVAAEVGLLLLAVAAAAVLTSVPTARELRAASATAPPASANVEGLFVTFEAVPIGTDTTVLIVRERPTVKPEPAPVDAVVVDLAGPTGWRTTLPLERVEDGRYEVQTTGLAPGAWHASVTVGRRGLPGVVAQFAPVIADPTTGPPTLEAGGTAAAVAIVVGTAAGVWFVRRRSSPRSWSEHVAEEMSGSRQ